MSARTETSTALLEGLMGEKDPWAWRELELRMRPIVHAFAKRCGLDEHAAADVAQETFLTVVRLFRAGRYDRAKGHLGAWVLGIANRNIANAMRKRARAPRIADTAELGSLQERRHTRELWEQESSKAILAEAMRRLLAEPRFDQQTFTLFRRFVVDQVPAKELGKEFGVSENAVYLAKRRCMSRLRSLLNAVKESWELSLVEPTGNGQRHFSSLDR